ncbi:hypothetical protein GGI12_002676 [Dipsacomyces acuminosporus]|nr:hypothetical protein GGI12_002676 [Dipsacomyces acuminosporus]
MLGVEFPGLGATLLGNSLYKGLRKITNRCRVQLITPKDSSIVDAYTDHIDDAKDETKLSSPPTLRSSIETCCPSLTDPEQAYYSPTPYLLGGKLQTGYGVLKLRKRDKYSDIKYDRELYTLPDQGTVSLDWYPARSVQDESLPIAIVLPGGGGSSEEYHIRYLVKSLADSNPSQKYNVVVLNHRGCARTPLTSPQVCNGRSTDDIREVVQHLRSKYPKPSITAVGLSIGANILTRYIGEEGSECIIAAAIAICCPFDIYTVFKAMDDPGIFNDHIFRPGVVATLKRYLFRHQEMIQSGPMQFDYKEIQKAKRVSTLETLVTARISGFEDCWEYYRQASSKDSVTKIQIPYLAINTLDDPVVPPHVIPVDSFKQNPNTALVLLKRGGHLALFTRLKPKIWYTRPVQEFLNAFV